MNYKFEEAHKDMIEFEELTGKTCKNELQDLRNLYDNMIKTTNKNEREMYKRMCKEYKQSKLIKLN